MNKEGQMPDDLTSGQSNTSQQGADSGNNGLGETPEKSPLEEAMAKMPEEQVPPNPTGGLDQPVSSNENSGLGSVAPNPPVPNDALPREPQPSLPPEPEIQAEPQQNVPVGGLDQGVSPAPISTPDSNALPESPEPQTAKAPDTDEFLKSILEEKPPAPPAEIPSMPNPPVEPQDQPKDIESSIDSQPVEPPPPPPTEPQSPLPSPQTNNVPSTDSGSIDGISTSNEQNNQMPNSSIDIPPKPQGSAGILKLVILVVLAAALVIGGYIAYTSLFSAKTTSSQGSIDLTATSSASISSNDQVRKSDLVVIQGKLLDFYAGEGSFPVSAAIVNLSSANNVVATSLVPNFISKLPADPDPSKYYGYKSDGKTFTLTAVLDDLADEDAVIQNGLAIYEVTNQTKATIGTVSKTPALTSTTSNSATPLSSDSSL